MTDQTAIVQCMLLAVLFTALAIAQKRPVADAVADAIEKVFVIGLGVYGLFMLAWALGGMIR